MKIFFYTLFISLFTFTFSPAQPPRAINYQGVARNSAGNPLVNHAISIRLSILDSIPTGNSLYSESHSLTTGQGGLFNLGIGNGTVLSGNFISINWGQNNKWLKTEMDTIGGSNFQLLGTTQFLSVPYALYAKSSGGRLCIGQYYAGGIIFYIDSTGLHGLVSATIDQGSAEWGCSGTLVNGTSESIGSGAQNTALILSACNDPLIAARLCDNLVLNGYSDWFLPSRFELNLMYKNLADNGWAGFSWDVFWSSSDYPTSNGLNSYSIGFYPDDQHRTRTDLKTQIRSVRATRSF